MWQYIFACNIVLLKRHSYNAIAEVNHFGISGSDEGMHSEVELVLVVKKQRIAYVSLSKKLLLIRTA